MDKTNPVIVVTDAVEVGLHGALPAAVVEREHDNSLVVFEGGEATCEIVVFEKGGFDRRLVAGMYAHGAAAYEDMARDVKARSGVAWANDDHASAQTLKALSMEMEKKAKALRIQQNNVEGSTD